MIISPLNSIRHRPVNSDLPNYQNTFVKDERFWNDTIFTFCQRFPNTTSQTVQIKADSAIVPTIIATHADNSTSAITPTTGIATPVNAAFTAGLGTLAAATYYYRVSAINAIGETLASTETSFVALINTGVNVNWGAVVGATGYKVYGRSTGAELLIATVGSVTTYLDNGSLTPAGALPTVNTTATFVSRYDTNGDGSYDTWYFEYVIDMSLFTTETFTTVTQDTETWESEPFIGDSEITERVLLGEVYKWEYFNFDNAFQLDFSAGLTFEIYIEGTLKKYNPQGEKTTYDNQRELTTLKATKQRTLEFKTLEMPRYLSETIDLITGLDNLVINDVAYVYEDDSLDVEEVDGSNFVTASAVLVDKEYLGINSSDIGFDCDVAPTTSEMSILTILNASGGETFTIPAGYQVHTLRSQWVSGTTVEVKLGTSVGGEQLASSRDVTSVDTDRTISIHSDIDRDANQDIYATVTGGVANLDLQLFQNTES